MVKLLFLQDINNSPLFELTKVKYQLHPSVNPNGVNKVDTKEIKLMLQLLNSGAVELKDISCPNLFVKTHQQYELNYSFLREQQLIDSVGQFKAIKNFIVEHDVLFYDTSSFDITSQGYYFTYLDYKSSHQETMKKVSSLLDFLVLNKEGMALFSDKNLLNQIKPLVQEALKQREYNKILHELLIMSLANTKSAQFLLDCGLNPNYQNKEGLTPLMITTNTGVAKALLKAGADIHLRNEIAFSGEQILGVTYRSSKYKSLIKKNAYEIHSVLAHNSMLKLLDEHLAKNNETKVAYSEHFQREYEQLKKNATTTQLIKAVKNNNSIVLENLHEFSSIFYDFQKHTNFIYFCTTENKVQWLEKALTLVEKEHFMKDTQRRGITSYLETAIYYKATESASVILKSGMCDKKDIKLKELASNAYDSKLIQTFYDVVPEVVSFHELLQSTHLELIEQWMKQGKHCDDKTFNLFCSAIEDFMNFRRDQLNMNRVKSHIIDCLATIIKMEPDETIKEKRLNQFIQHITYTSYDQKHVMSDELNKIMKSKIQRAIKFFPEKQSVILEKITDSFPDLVTHFEEKSFNKIISAPKGNKTKKENKATEESQNTLDSLVVSKPKRNKI